MKVKNYFMMLVLLVFNFTGALAQEKTISGTITDQSGLPLPGVNIIVKGTTNGTQSDFDGNYSINASAGDVLTFTYVGQKNVERTIGAANTINITMEEDATALDEVVVTALGIKREEKTLGYSAQGLKGDGMTEARESNISNALSGRIAGVQVTGTSGAVGASSRIVLRGASSITGNNEPLYVVDGVPINNSSNSFDPNAPAQGNAGSGGSGGGVDLPNGAADINPDDIESVQVLKGPNAAALYGLRAGNGVIVITTKKGNANKKFGVSINTNITFSDPLLLPDYQNSYGQGGDTSYFEFVDGASGGVGDGVDESWGPPLDVGLEFIQWNSQLNGGQPLPWRSYPDNVRDFLDTGVNISNNVSLSNKGFRLSIGNSDQKGMIPNTELKKITVGVSGSLDIGERMTASMSVNYINTDSDQLPVSGYNNENPFQQFIWSGRNVDFQQLRDWENLPLAPAGTPAAGTPLNWNHNFQNNPYWVLDTNLNTLEKDRIIGNVDLSYRITDWMTLSAKAGVDQFSQLTTNRQAIGSNNASNGTYNEVQRRYEEINASALLNIEEKITEDIGFSISVGGNHMNRERHNNFAFLPGLQLPDLYTLSNLQTGATASILSQDINSRINSLYGFGQLSYKDFFFIDFTARNDWASVLPVENNSFFYPSVSGTLILSDAFDMSGTGFDFLKLRGGWSKVGGIGALIPYRINQTFGLTGTGFGSQGFSPNSQSNPNLKPEEVTGVEVGLDAKLFGNRLRLSATYYKQDSKDLLLPLQVTQATGFIQAWNNVANMSNKGVEIQLGGTILENDDFRFDIDLNWAKNNNKVTELGGLDTYVLGTQWGVTLEARPGNPYGDLVGRDFERAPNGQVVYANGLPVIDNTQKILGNIAPDWTGGANFAIKYKNFDFSALVDAKWGGDVHSMTYAWGRQTGVLEETLIGRETGVVGSGVMADGNGNFVPNNVVVTAKQFNQATYSNSVESSAIFDATYVKLRQMTLGYTLPKKFLKNTPIQSLKFSVVGRNLALLYKKVPHIDPETGFSSANGQQGQEFGQYPSARTIGFNVNLKF